MSKLLQRIGSPGSSFPASPSPAEQGNGGMSSVSNEVLRGGAASAASAASAAGVDPQVHESKQRSKMESRQSARYNAQHDSLQASKSTSFSNLVMQQKHVRSLQQLRARSAKSAQKHQEAVGAASTNYNGFTTTNGGGGGAGTASSAKASHETPVSIRKDRDRLLKEKELWLVHVKKENDTLMSLLQDVRKGKAKIQEEMDKVAEERNELMTLKMDNFDFEKILSELPLGERGTFQGDAEPIENQHKTYGVHSLMCSIARRGRAVQEETIQELVDAIKSTEEHFLKGGDITYKIEELQAMANGIAYSGHSEGSGTMESGDESEREHAAACVVASSFSQFDSIQFNSIQFNLKLNLLTPIQPNPNENAPILQFRTHPLAPTPARARRAASGSPPFSAKNRGCPSR